MARKPPKHGRPSKYHEWAARNLDEIRARVAEGMTMRELAALCDTSTNILYQWRRRHGDLEAAILEGKNMARHDIESALIRKACGYDKECVETAVTTDGQGNVITATERKKVHHYPGDTRAMEFFLRNNFPEDYNKSAADVSVELPGVMVVPDNGNADWSEMVKKQQEQLAKSSVKSADALKDE